MHRLHKIGPSAIIKFVLHPIWSIKDYFYGIITFHLNIILHMFSADRHYAGTAILRH
jgi:hypothetical protein